MSESDFNRGFFKRSNSRDWNCRIMPGYAVLAVDTRFPEYPEGVIVERSDKAHPRHPDHESLRRLLQDRYFVRFSRLTLESRLREEPEFIERGADLEEVLSLVTETRITLFECCKDSSKIDYAFASAMLEDYRSDRLAYVHLMN
jgi:hypothetical protein